MISACAYRSFFLLWEVVNHDVELAFLSVHEAVKDFCHHPSGF